MLCSLYGRLYKKCLSNLYQLLKHFALICCDYSRPVVGCWCPYVVKPPLAVQTKLVILQHPSEVGRKDYASIHNCYCHDFSRHFKEHAQFLFRVGAHEPLLS